MSKMPPKTSNLSIPTRFYGCNAHKYGRELQARPSHPASGLRQGTPLSRSDPIPPEAFGDGTGGPGWELTAGRKCVILYVYMYQSVCINGWMG